MPLQSEVHDHIVAVKINLTLNLHTTDATFLDFVTPKMYFRTLISKGMTLLPIFS